MTRPSTTPLPSPSDCPPAVASAAEIGEAADDPTPLHRSPVALRVEAAGAAVAGAAAAVLPADGRAALAGAPELTGADWAAGAETLAEPSLRGAVTGAGAAGTAGVRVALPEPDRAAGVGAVLALALRDAAAPLVDDEADPPEVLPGVGVLGAGAAGACALGAALGALAAGAGATFAGGGAVDGGASLGVAGVPKPDGVQAHARPAPVTAIPSSDSTARLRMRARERTGPTLPKFLDEPTYRTTAPRLHTKRSCDATPPRAG